MPITDLDLKQRMTMRRKPKQLTRLPSVYVIIAREDIHEKEGKIAVGKEMAHKETEHNQRGPEQHVGTIRLQILFVVTSRQRILKQRTICAFYAALSRAFSRI